MAGPTNQSMSIPEPKKISKCCNRHQLRKWLQLALEELEAVNQEINQAISEGRSQEHAPDRRFFERMYRLRREKGKQIHAVNTRLHRLHEEPEISFEEFLLEQIREKIGSETFDRIKEQSRITYQEEILGLYNENNQEQLKATRT